VVVVDTGSPPPVAHGAKSTAEARGASASADPTVKVAAAKAENEKKRLAAERSARVAGALGAFGYALLFALAGVGAGYAATLGAHELVARGHALPLVGKSTRLVFPIVLGLIGVLPSSLAYKLGTVFKALVMGAVLGGVGWVAWGTGQGAFHGDRPLQALAFALAGFLAGLFVLGLLGGAKQPRPLPRRRS
jgi:hypothetical protein